MRQKVRYPVRRASVLGYYSVPMNLGLGVLFIAAKVMGNLQRLILLQSLRLASTLIPRIGAGIVIFQKRVSNYRRQLIPRGRNPYCPRCIIRSLYTHRIPCPQHGYWVIYCPNTKPIHPEQVSVWDLCIEESRCSFTAFSVQRGHYAVARALHHVVACARGEYGH